MRATSSVLCLVASLSLSLGALAAPQATSAPAAAKPATTTAPAAATKKKTTAVLPLLAVGLDDGTRAAIESALREAVAARGGKVQDAATTSAHVTASRLSCAESDTGCLVKLGFIATVEEIVAGRIEPAPGGHKLTLHLVDVEGARQVKRVEDLLASDPAGRKADMARIVGELLGEAPIGGDLRITCDKPGAIVLVDGVKVGETPLAAPIAGLARGRHTVEVRKAGHKSYQGHADVENGKVTELTVALISMVSEEEVVVATGPLESTEVIEAGPAVAPDDVSLIPMVLLVAGTGSLIVGVIGLVVGAGGLGYAAFLDQSIRTDPIGSGPLVAQQEMSAYVGAGGLVVLAVGVLAGGALIATSFFVE